MTSSSRRLIKPWPKSEPSRHSPSPGLRPPSPRKRGEGQRISRIASALPFSPARGEKNLSDFPPVRRVASERAAVALALDELPDVFRHLFDEQAHRDVSEGDREHDCEGDHHEK